SVLRPPAEHEGERRGQIELLLAVPAERVDAVDVVSRLDAALGIAQILELVVVLAGAEVLHAGSESRRLPEERRRQEIAQLGAPVVGRLVDDREGERMIQILVSQLEPGLEEPALAERPAQG